MLRANFEALSDSDERDAGGAEPAKIREEIERRATPAIEALHEHDVNCAALSGAEDPFEPGPNAAAT